MVRRLDILMAAMRREGVDVKRPRMTASCEAERDPHLGSVLGGGGYRFPTPGDCRVRRWEKFEK